MSEQKKTLNVGTLSEKTGKTKEGKEFTYFEIDLRQDIDIYQKGQKVNFSEYTIDGNEGPVTLHNKRVAVSDVDFVLGKAKESMKPEDYEQMAKRYAEKGVVYTLSVNSRNLA